jgi:uncharacterized protein (DUF305 family)
VASARLLPRGAQLVALVLVLCFLAGAIGYVVGRGRPPGRDSTDVGFLHDMITHHEQAVAMANVELGSGAEPGVEVFAREILAFQNHDLGRMQAMLEDWGYAREDRPERAMAWMGMAVAPADMPGTASQVELEALRSAEGRTADALFLALMVDHHAGGVHMASYAADHADDDEVRALARGLTRSQRQEIDELEAARRRYGLPDDPPVVGP